ARRGVHAAAKPGARAGSGRRRSATTRRAAVSGDRPLRLLLRSRPLLPRDRRRARLQGHQPHDHGLRHVAGAVSRIRLPGTDTLNRMRTLHRLALPLSLAAALVLPIGAGAKLVVGISDQNPATFRDPLYAAAKLTIARYVVPFDVTSDPSQAGRLEAWLTAARAAN